MLIFKVSGLLIILTVFSAAGYLKAAALKKRVQKLNALCISASKFGELARAGLGEVSDLIPKSFEEEIIRIAGGKPVLDSSYLKKEDIEIIDAFLNDIGMSDREAEYRRTGTYTALFEKQLNCAEKESDQLYKLYSSLGFLLGLSVCIFLM